MNENIRKRCFFKKAFIDETWLFLFYRFILVCLVAIGMVILVKTYIVTEIDTQETQAGLFVYNILNTKDGLSYYNNNIDRVYPGVIPVAGFQDSTALEKKLNERMNYGEQHPLAAQLTLFDAQGKTIGTAYYNKEWYDRWIVLVRVLWKGKGSATEYVEKRTVLLRYDEYHIEPGILQFSIVIPNS